MPLKPSGGLTDLRQGDTQSARQTDGGQESRPTLALFRDEQVNQQEQAGPGDEQNGG